MSIINLIRRYRYDRADFRLQLGMVINRYRVNIIKFFCSIVSSINNSFFTFHFRPINSEDYNLWSDPVYSTPLMALVMQGPLKKENNFTLESIRIYKKIFPNTHIIVSTWEDEKEKYIEQIKEEGVFVVLNKKPLVSGFGNVNFQIISTINGLYKAKELGVEYVYKTRCDQRINGINLNEYFVNLLNYFPSAGGFKQKKRIIASSYISLKFVPYLLTDMFQFGNVDDMINYWSCELDSRSKSNRLIKSIRDLLDVKMSEVLLCSSYLEKIGRKNKWTIEDSWHAFADHFLIVDRHIIDQFFYKYDYYNEFGGHIYRNITNNQYITFLDWFNLYTNFSNKKNNKLESVIDLPTRSTIINKNYEY
ncbi:MAG: hypothetical protein COY69_00840 [Candidatus Magasanikbacteria bacterium CG_4_10_14_0_8_um_filter_32_14]|uniref:WavE lipopolysaccharide synthesis n=1 Tax=Candidatus Magasanikbacteria bacterium CG_4_10_14_0_8_um_filter_32_14 TaxID=1974640 RepID=A0A2M7RA04_9BACT|nr:MAG: hypothetical protein COY69_00840 [Candidatus Magasanikbacteria bacterium CG_4_10_14_0_8_um_filter_32_14]